MATITWGKINADFDATFSVNGVSYIIAPDSSALKYIYWDPSSPNVFLGTNDENVAKGGGDHWIVKIQEDGALVEMSPSKLIETSMVKADAITNSDATYISADTEITDSWKTIVSLSFTTTGKGLYVHFSCRLQKSAIFIAEIDSFSHKLEKDGAEQETYEFLNVPEYPGSDIYAFSLKRNPGAGTHVWRVRGHTGGAARITEATNRSIYVQELKK